ncbi:MAG: hydroxymethylglutaryl-CoA lyase [Rhodobacterales bacterium]|nr:hydroxymethylglutaryl-CoA lyase [Rhodobacterales bacterium]
MREKVTVFEVGPRDGLQNEKALVPTETKIALVDALSACGFRKIEVTSFVSPKWVPQLADAGAVMAGIRRRPAVAYAVLTPNLKGLENALEGRADEVAIFAAASEGFSRKNINCSIEESYGRFVPLMDRAREAGVPVRGYVSCVTDCPYDGPTAPETVAKVAAALFDIGCYEISLGDTIGRGTPETVAAMLDAVTARLPAEHLAGHFHDTGGRALDNVAVCLERGVRTFDSSVSGLGGCPYAPGKNGNVATQSLVRFVEDKGYDTGIDPDGLAAAGRLAAAILDHRDTP